MRVELQVANDGHQFTKFQVTPHADSVLETKASPVWDQELFGQDQ